MTRSFAISRSGNTKIGALMKSYMLCMIRSTTGGISCIARNSFRALDESSRTHSSTPSLKW